MKNAVMAREGDLAPGTVGRFSEFGVPRANDRGQTAFIAVLRDAGLEPLAAKGLWLENTNGVLELIAGPSHIAPGTDRQFQVVNGFAINNYGQVAFDAYLGGSYTDGIWAQNRAGQLVPIALLDQRIDVSNNPAAPDIRTINYLSAGGFNDRGQVAFFATFAEGGRGIFISDLATIPEPASLSLLFAGAYLLLSGGRRR